MSFSYYSTITQIVSDLSTDIPLLLTAASLPALDGFYDEPSRDFQQNNICVYPDDGNLSAEKDNLILIVHLQLFSNTASILKYNDIIKDYLKAYDLSKIKFDSMGSINIDNWPPDGNATTNVFFTIEFIKENDSCD